MIYKFMHQLGFQETIRNPGRDKKYFPSLFQAGQIKTVNHSTKLGDNFFRLLFFL